MGHPIGYLAPHGTAYTMYHIPWDNLWDSPYSAPRTTGHPMGFPMGLPIGCLTSQGLSQWTVYGTAYRMLEIPWDVL